MDNSGHVAGRLGPFSYYRLFRVANDAALAILGNPIVCVCVVASAVWIHATVIREAMPAEQKRQTVRAEQTPIDRAWQSIAELHELRILQAIEKHDGKERQNASAFAPEETGG